ncbi:MAG: hypothetical protein Q9M48_09290 [Rhodobacterales bacterium]|nr:hypothetical protein [Rhodobacterales bacterium]
MIMPFLRLVLIYVVVAAAAVVFFNRDTVLPMIGWPWFGGESAEMAAENTPDDGAETTETAPEPAPQVVVNEDTESDTAQPIQTPVANAVVEPTATMSATVAETVQETTPSTPSTTTAANADTADTTAPTPAADLEALRNEARQAYWNGDIAKTETMYKAMAAANPENVDVLGELGNLYFSQRRFDDAGTYYHMAAKQLISNGNTQQAMPLINVLQSIAPAKAAELRNLAAANR